MTFTVNFTAEPCVRHALAAGGTVGLEGVMDLWLLAHLELFDVSGILLSWIVQLTALTQRLVVHGQSHCLHVHDLVVGNSGLEGKGEIYKSAIQIKLK